MPTSNPNLGCVCGRIYLLETLRLTVLTLYPRSCGVSVLLRFVPRQRRRAAVAHGVCARVVGARVRGRFQRHAARRRRRLPRGAARWLGILGGAHRVRAQRCRCWCRCGRVFFFLIRPICRFLAGLCCIATLGVGKEAGVLHTTRWKYFEVRSTKYIPLTHPPGTICRAVRRHGLSGNAGDGERPRGGH